MQRITLMERRRRGMHIASAACLALCDRPHDLEVVQACPVAGDAGGGPHLSIEQNSAGKVQIERKITSHRLSASPFRTLIPEASFESNQAN